MALPIDARATYRGPMRRLALAAHRVLFLLLLAFTLWNALQPGRPSIGGLSDKVWHATAFYVLTLSAACAAPRLPIAYTAAALAALGVAIELLQRLPAVNRSMSFADWIADLVGIAAAVAPALVWRWRDRAARRGGASRPRPARLG